MVISRSSIPQQIMKPGRKRIKKLKQGKRVDKMLNLKERAKGRKTKSKIIPDKTIKSKKTNI